jgi:hypothetical protein
MGGGRTKGYPTTLEAPFDCQATRFQRGRLPGRASPQMQTSTGVTQRVQCDATGGHEIADCSMSIQCTSNPCMFHVRADHSSTPKRTPARDHVATEHRATAAANHRPSLLCQIVCHPVRKSRARTCQYKPRIRPFPICRTASLHRSGDIMGARCNGPPRSTQAVPAACQNGQPGAPIRGS